MDRAFPEVGIGIVLLMGLFARLAAIIVFAIMAVATYVHVVADDPALFPLQPKESVARLVVIVLSAYVIWRGAGAWSLDLKTIDTTNDHSRGP